MLKKLSFLFISIFVIHAFSQDAEVKKTYLEDIFIWRISDELKLSAQDEKKFTEIQKNLNKKKAELNKKIQEATLVIADNSKNSTKQIEASLNAYRKLLAEYNQLSLNEFDSLKKLLGSKKFSEYLQIKAELTSKVKSLLIGDKDKKEEAPATNLPAPKVIVEKNEVN